MNENEQQKREAVEAAKRRHPAGKGLIKQQRRHS